MALYFISGCFMRHRRRITRITTLRKRLLAVRAELMLIEQQADYIPSPKEMTALQRTHWLLDDLATRTTRLEPQLWQRIETWRNTPWTPRQQIIRNATTFLGWWIAGTIALSYSAVGWFAPLFPAPWYILPVSTIAALICVILAKRKA
ncbi:MAG: hypothetical protein WDN72_06490 [Alphaproteobacteria bacterium]